MFIKNPKRRVKISISYINGSTKNFNIITDKNDPEDILKDMMHGLNPETTKMVSIYLNDGIYDFTINKEESEIPVYDKSKSEVIIFHSNFDSFSFTKLNGKYENYKNFWGHIVTNKPTRTEDKFAAIFSPDGTKVNHIDHSTFGMFRNKYKHEYINKISESEFVGQILTRVKDLSDKQAKALFICLRDNFPNHF